MGDIEKILTDAEVRPTSNRIMVMREIIAMDHTFTLSEMEERDILSLRMPPCPRFACALYMYFLTKAFSSSFTMSM